MKKTITVVLVLAVLLSYMYIPGSAEPGSSGNGTVFQTIFGKVYTFDKDTDYTFSSSLEYKSSDTADTYGTFQIAGLKSDLANRGVKDGVPAFTVSDGSIAIRYTYSDKLLNAPDEELHLVSDSDDDVDVLDLDENIEKGALILQRSIDHRNWHNVSIQTNAFELTPNQTEAMYTTTDPEMVNGCYYRLIVAYKTAIKVDSSSILGIIPNDTYNYQRTAEVYEFFAALENVHIEPLESNTKKFNLGEMVKVEHSASYSGQEDIKNGDLHYGWELGQFFVSGYTDMVEKNGNHVFLKNVGDVVSLWFNLKQNIDALNGDGDVTIAFDEEGSDQYFQTPTTKFGRGMLIIRYTDHENVKHDPIMYYDYLAANTTLGANTRVQLFEEGDYEVALDYEIEEDGFAFLGSTGHYRIFFKFSVRNANCMVYPFDVKTGAELTNSSLTENGFYLDLARSRYLKIYVKKQVRAEGIEGLTEDTRFNTAAKDGDHYTDEGIYTITAQNEYTGLKTEKRIYVGTDPIMKAHMVTGRPVPELVQLVSNGATIYDDGTIELPPEVPDTEPIIETEPVIDTEVVTEAPTEPEPTIPQTEPAPETTPTESAPGDSDEDTTQGNTGIIVGIVAGVAAVAGIGGGVAMKKRRTKADKDEEETK